MPLFYTDKGFLKAVIYDDHETVSKYLARKNKDHYLSLKDGDGYTAVTLAVIYNLPEMVKKLAESGAALDVIDNYGRGLMALAFETGNNDTDRMKMARTLLDAGIDPNAPATGLYNPLYYAAAYKGNAAMAGMLLDRGANIDASAALPVILSKKNMAQTAIRMINEGGTLNRDGVMPGHNAIASGSIPLLTLLKEKGVDFKTPDGNGKTTLHKAAEKGLAEVVSFLIDEGVDIALQDETGKTALHYAVQAGNASIVQTLLAKGARTDVEDFQNMTPVDIAKQGNNVAIARMLEAKQQQTLSQEATPLTAAAGVIPPSEAETWVLMGAHQVARVGVYPALGRRLTEVFNFESRGLMIISENLKTGAENVTPLTSFDAISDTALEKAVAAFRNLGGKVDDSAVFGRQRLDKKPATGLGG